MSKIGLIDVDGHDFPNLPLMKLSAWHKGQGDRVEWYEPMFGGHYDRVYMSKVFSFSEDYAYHIDADEIIKGGTGYCISLQDGREVFNKNQDHELPAEIEHIYPDYGLYGESDRAMGFLTRGCPRQCGFCHVAAKEGCRAYKTADLAEWWHGQKHITLLDPNILAAKERLNLLEQLAKSRAIVDFNQGLDIRLMTDEIAEALAEIRFETVHFAWDRYQDKDIVLPRFESFRRKTTKNAHNLQVYVLCGYDTTFEQDLERIYTLRDMGFAPYVMLYDKAHIPVGDDLRRLQRWVNNRFVFWSVETFEEYQNGDY